MALRLAARMADFMSRLHERDGMLHLAPAPLPAIEQVEVPNVWLGVTPGTQGSASRQLPALVKVKATVRFVSMEPLLEPVNLDTYIQALDWIIVSGESGLGWRPMDLDGARAIRDVCVDRRVPFLFKQMAGKNPENMAKELDGVVWRQMPRRELAPMPRRARRKVLRAWAMRAETPERGNHLPASHAASDAMRLGR